MLDMCFFITSEKESEIIKYLLVHPSGADSNCTFKSDIKWVLCESSNWDIYYATI